VVARAGPPIAAGALSQIAVASFHPHEANRSAAGMPTDYLGTDFAFKAFQVAVLARLLGNGRFVLIAHAVVGMLEQIGS
jgi:hypothetical protein